MVRTPEEGAMYVETSTITTTTTIKLERWAKEGMYIYTYIYLSYIHTILYHTIFKSLPSQHSLTLTLTLTLSFSAFH